MIKALPLAAALATLLHVALAAQVPAVAPVPPSYQAAGPEWLLPTRPEGRDAMAAFGHPDDYRWEGLVLGGLVVGILFSELGGASGFAFGAVAGGVTGGLIGAFIPKGDPAPEDPAP